MKDWTVRTASVRAGVVGGIYIFVHTATAPTDEEWEQVISVFKDSPRLDRLRLFVHTLGGAPNAAQRAKLNTTLGSAKPRVSIVTPSAIARAAGTALAWFNPAFRVFGPDEVARAFDHLDVDARERQVISKMVEAYIADLKPGRSERTGT